MTRLLDIGLGRLSDMLMDMASLSEKSVATSIDAYMLGRKNSEEIHGWSEELKLLQEEVNDLATEMIARYQPVATDLRYIKACMEISYGFSRFGRYAYDIAEVLEMFGDLSNCDHVTVDETAKVTKEMIRMSIEAFAKKDIELAMSIEKMDDFVDEKYRQHIIRIIGEEAKSMRCALSTTLILRYLERIADHSSYIGDSVVYIVNGQRAPRK
ncbi:MAG: phosphate signaling complex PhoU family protein [Nitrososphaerales archaeon]